MYEKDLAKQLGFSPKEKAVGIYNKVYADGYAVEIDFNNKTINYGKDIKSDSKTTQNFSQAENFVILECVNRLLEKGYKPENIVLEKTWSAGHGTSKRLDICVNREDGSEYLFIECKTCGKEFDKEFTRMRKDGGQLFTYFKFSNKPDIIMLYASELRSSGIIYRNEIVKIEENYRTGDLRDFYEKWNKITKDNGVFESWVKPYNFESKALAINELEDIKPEDSSFVFNRFLEILRHNVVSDKPNAFNKIFTLFLCKIYDEKENEGTDNELGFQWKEGVDDDVSFQLRLTDLYKKGMNEFLEKKITDISEDEFDKKYQPLFSGNDTLSKELKSEINRLRLEKNNEFAIKEVYDRKSFEENAKVVKEIVELLQNYKIRYTQKQQYLSDFFELLLTTGLKQESGQFFTPVPIAQFIMKSLPIDSFVKAKLQEGKRDELLPYIIDYAAGSGHFITESMHEIQKLLSTIETKNLKADARSFIDIWRIRPYDWALQYIYGIEKDYRLVKVGKVGCYLHGDGLANVVHSDGLASFKHLEYKGKLKIHDGNFPKENKQFEVVVSNPPYSVSSFKNAARNYYTKNDFELYDSLTDNSSEIECLFVERTKQLLKDGGVAGVILPSSILSNEGIYTKAREIILQNFEIIAIAELGSNTFMATGTNTVVLFLRRRNNYDSINLQESVERFFSDWQDVTLNGIEKPFSKYVEYVWNGLSWEDYLSLLKNEPYDFIEKESELYKEYRKKLKAKTEKEFWNTLIEIEKEKLLYFILAYPQKDVVLVKTGEKDAEKRFLGYEFSYRRGSEGIHPMQRGRTISECTKLFDEERFDNEEKASTYIYKAFFGDCDFPIHESLKENISRVSLVDMLTFDRTTFAKSISTTIKKKVKIESKWDIVRIGQVAATQYGFTDKASDNGSVRYLRITDLNNDGSINIDDEKKFINPSEKIQQDFLLKNNDIVIARSGSVGKSAIFKKNKYEDMIFASYLIRLQADENKILPDYLFYFTKTQMYWNQVEVNSIAVTQPNLNAEKIKEFEIPLPPKEIQQKIVAEIEVLEKKESKAKENIDKGKEQIENICLQLHANSNKEKLGRLAVINPSKTEIANLDGNTLISFVEMSSVSNDGYIAKSIDAPYSKIKKGSYTYFREDDIIIAKITPCMENGKCALATNLTNSLALGSSEFHVFRANSEKINEKYLFILLNRKSVRIEAEKNMTGASGHRRVPIAFYENLEIPLIPLPEQQKIVSEIEKIEAQMQDMQKELEQLSEQKKLVLEKYL